MLWRIKHAAVRVCEPAPSSSLEYDDWRHCVSEATKGAVARLDAPTVTAAYQGKQQAWVRPFSLRANSAGRPRRVADLRDDGRSGRRPFPFPNEEEAMPMLLKSSAAALAAVALMVTAPASAHASTMLAPPCGACDHARPLAAPSYLAAAIDISRSSSVVEGPRRPPTDMSDLSALVAQKLYWLPASIFDVFDAFASGSSIPGREPTASTPPPGRRSPPAGAVL